MKASHLEVSRAELAESAVRELAVEPGEGEVVVAVERFALTSNNVTYAVLGDALRYWQFFPSPGDDTGVVPVWGVGRVVASRNDDVDVDERWYGYVPMGTHVVVRPGATDPTGVTDASPHREGLAGVYQRYVRLAADDLHDPDRTDLELLYRPLFTTSFLLAEQLAGSEAPEVPDVVVVTSASSKTSIALAHLLRDHDVEVVGLTSPANVTHVRSLDLHDRVLGYDDVAAVSGLTGQAVLVDVAGRRDVVADVHRHLPDGLAQQVAVGVTHHDSDAGAEDVDGLPESRMFFAPATASRLARAWGRDVLGTRIAEAWKPFVQQVADDVTVRALDGLDAAADAWADLVRGDVDPTEGLVVVTGA